MNGCIGRNKGDLLSGREILLGFQSNIYTQVQSEGVDMELFLLLTESLINCSGLTMGR
jgi:hypothetical protein